MARNSRRRSRICSTGAFTHWLEYFSSRRGQGKDFSVRPFFLGLAFVGHQPRLFHPGQQGIGLAAAQGPDQAQMFFQVLIQIIPVQVAAGQDAQDQVFSRVPILFRRPDYFYCDLFITRKWYPT